jgi:hypothetical protein
VAQWKERKATEEKRQESGVADERLIYYANFYDLKPILLKNWPLFADALGDRKSIKVWLDTLERYRDPDAHRRELLPHQKHMILGIEGEIRGRLVRYRSKQETATDYFPRIESVRDNLGNIWTPDRLGLSEVLRRAKSIVSILGGDVQQDPPDRDRESEVVSRETGTLQTGMTLRPGDKVEFVVTARDPLDDPLEYGMRIPGGDFQWQSDGNFVWQVTEAHVRELLIVDFEIRSPRPFHASGATDHHVEISYIVLPPKK